MEVSITIDAEGVLFAYSCYCFAIDYQLSVEASIQVAISSWQQSYYRQKLRLLAVLHEAELAATTKVTINTVDVDSNDDFLHHWLFPF